jgi:hypothetical protein
LWIKRSTADGVHKSSEELYFPGWLDVVQIGIGDVALSLEVQPDTPAASVLIVCLSGNTLRLG